MKLVCIQRARTHARTRSALERQSTARSFSFWQLLFSRSRRTHATEGGPGGRGSEAGEGCEVVSGASGGQEAENISACSGPRIRAASPAAPAEVATKPPEGRAEIEMQAEEEVMGWWSGVDWGDEHAATTSAAEKKKAEERWRKAAEGGA